ncbi:DUF485 domain-containing protein [Salinithrix halophila]|uniref:DUF485 domain-containing protein n=1 Tax=Salinithrix halophila TaxID=1485204 RepID=A0ABV8JG14_9BACL
MAASDLQSSRAPENSEWEQIAETRDFKVIIRRKKWFILPATLFFLAYYIALPVLNGYTDWLHPKVIGSINLAYLFALSQIIMAWVISLLYVRHANRTDRHSDNVATHRKEGLR